MPTKAQLLSALSNADAAGDSAAAKQLANSIKNGEYSDDEISSIGDAASAIGTGLGAGLENLGTLGSAIVAEPVSGLAGIAGSVLPGPEGQGEDWVSATQEALTYTPMGETAQAQQAAVGGSEAVQKLAAGADLVGEHSGGAIADVYDAVGLDPAVGYAVGKMIPVAAAEMMGLKAPSTVAKVAGKQGQRLASKAAQEVADINAIKGGAVTPEGITALADDITARPEGAAEVAQFDPAIVQAAYDLGFDEVPASVAAGNAQFRDIAQGMNSIAGSQAKAQYGLFLEQLSTKADELIVAGGGDIDKAALSSRYFDESERTLKKLGEDEGLLYTDIKAAVTPSARVDTSVVGDFIDSKVRDYGGVDDMPKVYQDIYRIVRDGNGKPRSPTYAAFDQKRRDIGQAIGKKSGPYGDAESIALKDIYGAMKQQQRNIVDAAGVGGLQDAADILTIKRKALEGTNVKLLGKDLSKDLMPQVAAKITGLPKGNVTKFSQLIEGIPESMRSEVVVSALNDIMRGTGADQKGMGAARFVGFMNDLNRSPSAKTALYKYLPKKTQKSLDNLHKVANGVYKANKENITTGKISQFFPENSGFVSRLMGAGKAMIIGTAGAKGGRMAAEAADAVSENVAEFLSGSSSRAQAANEFIASPQLQELMRRAVRDGVVDGGLITEKTKRLEGMVERSKHYKAWADKLEGSDAAKLASMGVSSYLLSPEVPSEDSER